MERTKAVITDTVEMTTLNSKRFFGPDQKNNAKKWVKDQLAKYCTEGDLIFKKHGGALPADIYRVAIDANFKNLGDYAGMIITVNNLII